MRLKFNGSSDESIQFVMGILPMIGNIREFEVNNSSDETPFSILEDGHRRTFRFALRDDRGTELWLDTNCGYGGSGPYATGVILQVLGLRDDYGIQEKSNVKATNLQPVHRLNVLVATPDAHLRLRGLFWINMEFKSASQLQNAKTALRCLGSLHAAEGREDVRVPEEILAQRGQVEFGEYAINQVLGIHHPLPEQLTAEQIQSVVRLVAEEYGAEFTIIDY